MSSEYHIRKRNWCIMLWVFSLYSCISELNLAAAEYPNGTMSQGPSMLINNTNIGSITLNEDTDLTKHKISNKLGEFTLNGDGASASEVGILKENSELEYVSFAESLGLSEYTHLTLKIVEHKSEQESERITAAKELLRMANRITQLNEDSEKKYPSVCEIDIESTLGEGTGVGGVLKRKLMEELRSKQAKIQGDQQHDIDNPMLEEEISAKEILKRRLIERFRAKTSSVSADVNADNSSMLAKPSLATSRDKCDPLSPHAYDIGKLLFFMREHEAALHYYHLAGIKKLDINRDLPIYFDIDVSRLSELEPDNLTAVLSTRNSGLAEYGYLLASRYGDLVTIYRELGLNSEAAGVVSDLTLFTKWAMANLASSEVNSPILESLSSTKLLLSAVTLASIEIEQHNNRGLAQSLVTLMRDTNLYSDDWKSNYLNSQFGSSASDNLFLQEMFTAFSDNNESSGQAADPIGSALEGILALWATAFSGGSLVWLKNNWGIYDVREFTSLKKPPSDISDLSISQHQAVSRLSALELNSYVSKEKPYSSIGAPHQASAFKAIQTMVEDPTDNVANSVFIRKTTMNPDISELIRKIGDKKEKWKQEARAASSNLIQASISENDKELEKLTSELDSLLTESNQQDINLPLLKADTIELSTINNCLNDEEGLLIYGVSKNQLYIWFESKQASVNKIIDINRHELSYLVKRLRQSAQSTPFQKKDVDFFDIGSAKKLYQLLIKPIERELSLVSHVNVLLDSPLNLVPLYLLIKSESSDPASETMALEDYAWLVKGDTSFSSIPSLSAMCTLRCLPKPETSKQFIGFGDPVIFNRLNDQSILNRKYPELPFSGLELHLIAKSFDLPSNEVVFTRKRATKELLLKQNLSDYQTIVFATHSVPAHTFENQLEPGLILSGDNDFILQASEIGVLELSADTVILSACNTLEMDSENPNFGLGGLVKSFLYAGANSVLASHWPVDSKASTLLTTKLLKRVNADGISLAKALQFAMKDLLLDANDKRYTHPKYWAPFTLIGEGNYLQELKSACI